MLTEVHWESISLQHISTFIVKRRPVLSVVIITTAKEEVRMNIGLGGGGVEYAERFCHVFFFFFFYWIFFYLGKANWEQAPYYNDTLITKHMNKQTQYDHNS